MVHVDDAVMAADQQDNKVVFLGEGDFGFAAAMAPYLGSTLIATTCKREDDVRTDSDAVRNLQRVLARGGKVLYEVDATKLCATLGPHVVGTIGRIIFNFPCKNKEDQDPQSLLSRRAHLDFCSSFSRKSKQLE